MIKKIITAACLMTLSASSMHIQAQATQKLTASKINEYGLIYRLPLTVIDVTIEAECTTLIPGEYATYAQKYLQMDPITESSVNWKLKSVTLTTRGVSDPNEEYLVQFKSGSSPFMVINSEQFPVSVNTEEEFTIKLPKLPVAMDANPSILESEAAHQAVTEEMLHSTSSAKRAQLAASRIVELRQYRSDIISGQAESMPSDGVAMKLVLDNITAQEEALTAMFVGVKKVSTQVKTFTFTPDSTGNQECVIARLSAIEGLVAPDDLSGAPIYLNLEVKERGELPVNEKGEVKRFPKGGLAYRLPGSADISVSYDGQQIASESVRIAQLGVVFGIDPSIFTDKKAPSSAIFNPTTGAIVEVKPMTIPSN